MIMSVLAVFDTASACYARPIFCASVGAGVRMFVDEVNRASADNVMNSHPEDFQLFNLGAFDDSSGLFRCLELPVRVLTGSEALTKGGQNVS